MKRCNWINLEGNTLYEDYHDNEWGIESHDDSYLFEMLVLESFQAGLSWLTILKKREAFRNALDSFNYNLIAKYTSSKIEELLNDKSIIRNRLKLLATVDNAKAFIKVQNEQSSFSNYIWSFTNNEIIIGDGMTRVPKNSLSDLVSKDLKKRGFRFMGSITTYSYLEAIGVMKNHDITCFKR